MARAKRTKKAVSSKTMPDLRGVKGQAVEALSNLAQQGGKVQVLGRVRNGKVEFDQESLAELVKKFPNANMSFVAVNAPFDPVKQTVS